MSLLMFFAFLDWLVFLVVFGLPIYFLFFRKRFTYEEDYRRKLELCKKDLKSAMEILNCHPLMLRLAWSEAATFDRSIHEWPHCGGANGTIRFDHELSHEVNAGISIALDTIRPVKEKYPLISWADLIQMAGALAVELLGGPKINMVYGRLDADDSIDDYTTDTDTESDDGSDREIDLPVKKPQRATLSSKIPVAIPPYPDGSNSADIHMRNVFYRMGFTNKELVALMGAHTIGRAFQDRSGVCPYSTGDQGATRYTRQSSFPKVTNSSCCCCCCCYCHLTDVCGVDYTPPFSLPLSLSLYDSY